MTHLFQHGNRAAIGHGRPPKALYIKALEAGNLEAVPLDTLRAIASGDRTALHQLNIPYKQVTLHIRAIATGYLSIRGEKHE